MTDPKETAKRVIEKQPDDASYEDLLRALFIEGVIQRGIDDIERRDYLV